MLFNNRSEFLYRFLAEDSAKVPEKDQQLSLASELLSKSPGLKVQTFDRDLKCFLR